MVQLNTHLSRWWEVTNNNRSVTVLVITIFVLIWAVIWFKLKLSSSSNGAPSLPPGPISLPIVGYLPFLQPELHTQFANMARTYGPIFKCKVGSKLHVVINSAELAKVVVRDQDEAFSDRDQTIAALALTSGGRDIVLSNNNDNWRKLRKIFVHEMLSNKNLEASGLFRRDEVRKTITNVFSKIGEKVNIREISFATEANVITLMVWENSFDKGVKYSDLVAELDIVASNITQIFGQVNLSDLFPSLARLIYKGSSVT